jgi:H+/Cl- antiporter ClcA
LPPAGFAVIVILARTVFGNSQGSGIPQCIAAMRIEDRSLRESLLSLKIAAGKIFLTVIGLFCGASIGREGPTVQVGASVMMALGRTFHRSDATLIMAGSAAGIAAAFNAPLAGIVFTIEELSRSFEAKTSGLILATTVIGGLTATALGGNYAYFGYASGDMGTAGDWLALVFTAIACGLLGGGFSRFVIEFSNRIGWQDRVRRRTHPILFACGCGLVVALCGLASGGSAFGTGYREAFTYIHDNAHAAWFYVPLKLIATTASTISGIPGGLFAPSLSIGAGIGSLVAQALPVTSASQFALLGMAAYLSAVVQSPITSTVIMAEMTDNHAMVFPLLISAMVGSWISRQMSANSLYHALAENFVPGSARQGTGAADV